MVVKVTDVRGDHKPPAVVFTLRPRAHPPSADREPCLVVRLYREAERLIEETHGTTCVRERGVSRE